MRDYYKEDHKLAKHIICSSIVVLANLSFFVSFPYDILLTNISIILWFWGINPTAYLIENIRKHAHKHDLL